MNKILTFVLTILALSVNIAASAGTFVSGSTGADGPFNPTANTEIQLPPSGIFNFTTVNIPSGITVKFIRNAANTPVYILATGDITIAGTININGGDGTSSSSAPGVGGPGAHDGGWGGIASILSGFGGKGLGPGGGGGGPSSAWNFAGGGGFGTAGRTYSSSYGTAGLPYGNESLIPLIGGSGGGGGAGTSSSSGGGGGGGGGAILLASSGTITVASTGFIQAYGGNGYNGGGGGSGGAIKLIANSISGNGLIYAREGSGGYNGTGAGGNGRIRLEAYTMTFSATTLPVYTTSVPGSVFVANTPDLRIASIAGIAVPTSPTGSYLTPDVALPSTTTNPVSIVISASNIPVGTTVTVSLLPQYGNPTDVTATLSGTQSSSTATASVSLPTSTVAVIMAQSTFTLQTAMLYDGEKIDRVRVAVVPGKKSETVYISESGKEIKAEKLILAGLIR